MTQLPNTSEAAGPPAARNHSGKASLAYEGPTAPDLTTDEATRFKAEQRWGRFLGLRRNAWMEILVFLGVAMAVDQIWFDGHRFIDVFPHPFWIIVLLTSVQYGAGAGIISTLLGTILLLGGNLPEQGLDQDLHAWMLDMSMRPLLWLAASVVIGELSARNIRERTSMGKQLIEARSHEKRIAESFEELQTLRERLEVRVAGQLRTVSKTWKAARAIERLDPARVLMGITEMVSTLLEPEKFSVFTFTNNQLQASIQKGWQSSDDYERVFSEQSPLFRAVVGDQRVLSIADPEDEILLEGQGVLAGPLINEDTGEIFGMLKIEDLGFGQLSVSSLENFRFICQWIGSVYGNAVKHEQSQARQFFNTDENLYSEAFFNRHKIFLTDLARRVGFDLSMITIRLDNFRDLPEQTRLQFTVALGQAVEEILRDTDLAFHQQSKNWEFAIILAGTSEQNAKIVEGRLERLLGEKLSSFTESLEYSFQILPLNRPEKPKLDTPKTPMLGDGFAESQGFFQIQKRFLTDLARRLDFPLTQLRIQCMRFNEMPEAVRQNFGKSLGQTLADQLRDTDQALNFHNETGDFVLLLPGATASQVEALQSRVSQAITECLGEGTEIMSFGFDVTTLHGKQKHIVQH